MHWKGRIGIAIWGSSMFNQISMVRMTWFFPNKNCYRRPVKIVNPLPTTPTNFPIILGTSLIGEEIMFLHENEVNFDGITKGLKIPSIVVEEPSLLQLRIDVNTFPEMPNFLEHSCHPKSRNGRGCRCRYIFSDGNQKKISLASNTHLSVVFNKEMNDKIRWGLLFGIFKEKTKNIYWI